MRPTVVGSIFVVGGLTYALFHSVCDLKTEQMNVQCSQIQELMLYEFEMEILVEFNI